MGSSRSVLEELLLPARGFVSLLPEVFSFFAAAAVSVAFNLAIRIADGKYVVLLPAALQKDSVALWTTRERG